MMAQETDSIHAIEEVILIGKKKDLNLKQAKPLSGIDDYLQQAAAVAMIKRGGYAWEPFINGMATERTVITIEGMHIFGACTDKMDPVTSYVEVSNLMEANVTQGQQGAGFGPTIGGGIDLKRNRSGFTPGWKTMVSTGFETANNQKIAGGAVSYATPAFFIDTDAMFRDASNYTAGNNREVKFSQFTKLNLSAMSGVKLAPGTLVEASVIYDKATDVGYPALPMDVSLAEAVITSARYEVVRDSAFVNRWESKLYYNAVTHIMDDTKRPVVPIRMDMPGETQTYGGFSTARAKLDKNIMHATLNAYYNRSYAEMTMYPNDPAESPMFMLTWPDVRTFVASFFAQHDYEFSCHSVLKSSAGITYHSNNVASDMGLQSLQIFYPEMPRTNSRMLKSLATTYSYKKGVEFSVGAGYGERAPSVSEGYGFYLFNSFDRYDYVGNPHLRNEKSLEANAAVGYSGKLGKFKLSGSYFHILDYIIGQPEEGLLPMTIGSDGVRIYRALDHATILNTALDADYKLSDAFAVRGQLTYSRGQGSEGENLPLISPLRYTAAIAFKHKSFNAEAVLGGNAVQSQYAPKYGEDRTPAFAIVNYTMGYLFYLQKYRLHSRAGVENLLDAHYSTFGDWNNIPRTGRNFFVNLIFSN